jgi:hypothetical protein
MTQERQISQWRERSGFTITHSGQILAASFERSSVTRFLYYPFEMRKPGSLSHVKRKKIIVRLTAIK